jgi:hypothetical protein
MLLPTPPLPLAAGIKLFSDQLQFLPADLTIFAISRCKELFLHPPNLILP